MINEIEIVDNTLTAVSWLPKVSSLDNGTIVKFKPGLNFIWGPNASGKSTLLTLLARMFHCEQGQDEQVVTNHSVHELFSTSYKDGIKTISKYDGVRVGHDGSTVTYFNPTIGKGQIYPGHFDDDFFEASIKNHTYRGSCGQTTLNRVLDTMDHINKNNFKKYRWTENQFTHHKGNEIYKTIENFLNPKGDDPNGVNHPTILLDEPTHGLDLVNQNRFWKFIQKHEKNVQFIIATHSLFACDINSANYITFDTCRHLVKCKQIKQSLNRVFK